MLSCSHWPQNSEINPVTLFFLFVSFSLYHINNNVVIRTGPVKVVLLSSGYRWTTWLYNQTACVFGVAHVRNVSCTQARQVHRSRTRPALRVCSPGLRGPAGKGGSYLLCDLRGEPARWHIKAVAGSPGTPHIWGNLENRKVNIHLPHVCSLES